MKRVHAQLKKLKRHVNEHAKTLKRMEQRGHLTAFRSIGLDAEPWPKWVVELKGHSGCYVIRDGTTGRVLYVGSALKNLYETMTRHFQSWGRGKRFWKGLRGQGAHDPGLVYKRAECELAIVLTEPDERFVFEAALIQRFAPQDNLVKHPDGGTDVTAESVPLDTTDSEDEHFVDDFDGEAAPF